MSHTSNNQQTSSGAITVHSQSIPPRSERLMRLNKIIGEDGLLPISRATFYELVKQGILPKPIKLATRISCWREADILDFINNSELGG